MWLLIFTRTISTLETHLINAKFKIEVFEGSPQTCGKQTNKHTHILYIPCIDI